LENSEKCKKIPSKGVSLQVHQMVLLKNSKNFGTNSKMQETKGTPKQWKYSFPPNGKRI